METILNKAKRYDKALEIVRKLQSDWKSTGNRAAKEIEEAFPELKESEDEKIRREIISAIKEDWPGHTDWIAWLEAQGEQSSDILHDVNEEPEEQREIFCEWESSDAIWHDVAFYHADTKTFWHGGQRIEDVVKWAYVNEMLEKHGKQKSTVKVEPKFKVGDIIRFKGNETLKRETETHKIISYDNELYVFDDGTTDLFCEQDLYELVKQKSTDKVEPKFHENEWITNGDYTWKIVGIKPLDYILQSQDGNIVDDTISHVDEQFHSFTIQDAKDGDVLVVNNEIFIYAHRKQMYSIAVAQCFVDSAGGFYLDGEFGYTEKGNSIHPATKEQRDLLFQKMKESDYEWDTDKKELKKIEQKPANKVEPKFKIGDNIEPIDTCLGSPRTIYKICDGFYETNQGTLDFEFENNWRLIEQKPAWGEEDEGYYDAIIAKLEVTQEDALLTDNEMDFLKSLKEKVLPQPKQEWSEDDESRITTICTYLQDYARLSGSESRTIRINEYCDWLKSLRPKSQWKPSDEQMERLKGTINSLPHQEVLYSLYQDLKKLKD